MFALAATALVSSGANAAPTGFTLEMAGQVPTICRAEVRQQPEADNAARSTPVNLDEYCNDPDGYRVFAEPSAELAGATLLVDGTPIMLSSSAPTLVSSSDHADIATRSLELQLPNGRVAPDNILSFRIEPI
jgi:hypothetical protein